MGRIVVLVGLWFVAGYVMAALIIRFLDLPLVPFQGGIVGLLIGLVWLALITSTERGRHLFYEGPEEDEEGEPLVVCLWVTPFVIMMLAAIGWVYWFLLVWMTR